MVTCPRSCTRFALPRLRSTPPSGRSSILAGADVGLDVVRGLGGRRVRLLAVGCNAVPRFHGYRQRVQRAFTRQDAQVVRRQLGPLQDQLLDLRGNTLTPHARSSSSLRPVIFHAAHGARRAGSRRVRSRVR